MIRFFAGLMVVFATALFAGCGDDEKPAAKAKEPAQASAKAPAPQAQAAKPASASPTPQAAAKDPRKYLTVADVKNITGRNFKMSYVDMKYNGKPDLTFSTTDEGHVVLTATVLRGNDYEQFYNQFRSQDYKPMEYAFWGPKNENPPRMLGFRKGDTMIVLIRYVDDGGYYVSVEMLERLAKTVASRL